MRKSSRKDDAYGLMMLDYHQGISTDEIVERDDGWIGMSSGPETYFSPYAEWKTHEKEAMKYVQGNVLDIGCGAGRHSLYLQEQGYRVLGIDTSPLAVQVAKERGLEHARTMNITQISAKLGTFETMLMMGSNFGLFGNLKRARWILRRMHSMTTPDARIIAETLDPHQTSRKCHLDYHTMKLNRGEFAGQLKIRIRYLNNCGPWFEYLKVSRDEMKFILEGTGWKIAQFIPETGAVYVAIIGKI